jgi:hypothetical protein
MLRDNSKAQFASLALMPDKTFAAEFRMYVEDDKQPNTLILTDRTQRLKPELIVRSIRVLPPDKYSALTDLEKKQTPSFKLAEWINPNTGQRQPVAKARVLPSRYWRPAKPAPNGLPIRKAALDLFADEFPCWGW